MSEGERERARAGMEGEREVGGWEQEGTGGRVYRER